MCLYLFCRFGTYFVVGFKENQKDKQSSFFGTMLLLV